MRSRASGTENHPTGSAGRARLLAALTLALSACNGGAGDKPPVKAPDPLGDEVCLGKVFIDIDAEGRRTIGDLVCAGTCADGSKCKPVTSAAGDRSWCGCPGFGEPALCHVAKVKVGDAWAPDCQGPCPIATDVCTPSYQQVDTPPGAPRRLAMSCECEAAGGE
jgi:hypothetical protein